MEFTAAVSGTASLTGTTEEELEGARLLWLPFVLVEDFFVLPEPLRCGIAIGASSAGVLDAAGASTPWTAGALAVSAAGGGSLDEALEACSVSLDCVLGFEVVFEDDLLDDEDFLLDDFEEYDDEELFLEDDESRLYILSGATLMVDEDGPGIIGGAPPFDAGGGLYFAT